MSKMTNEWHERCLANWRASHERNKEELAGLQASVDRQAQEIEFYTRQIAMAKAQGKDGFDREKFMKQRAAKS